MVASTAKPRRYQAAGRSAGYRVSEDTKDHEGIGKNKPITVEVVQKKLAAAGEKIAFGRSCELFAARQFSLDFVDCGFTSGSVPDICRRLHYYGFRRRGKRYEEFRPADKLERRGGVGCGLFSDAEASPAQISPGEGGTVPVDFSAAFADLWTRIHRSVR